MYNRIPAKSAYSPKRRYKTKKPIRGFRDLEIYQRAQEIAIKIIKHIQPFLAEKQYSYEREFCELSLNIPIQIASAHTQRFEEPEKAMGTLNNVMESCNKMIVFLEQIRDIYTEKANIASNTNNKDDTATSSVQSLECDLTENNKVYILCEEMIKSYNIDRIKTLNLLKAWKRFYKDDKK